ncbi:hypothetical protein CCACVL1_08634, partial [Corchorus capsularis]
GYGFRPSDEELIGYLEDITNNRDISLNWKIFGNYQAFSAAAWFAGCGVWGVKTFFPKDLSNSSKLFPEGEVSNDSSGLQNQSSTKERDYNVQNDETCPQEGSNQHNFLDRNQVSNLTSNLENHAAVDATSGVNMDQGATSGCLITELEASKDSVFNQNQFSIRERGNLTENLIVVDSNKNYPEERSNQHNIVAEHEGSNLLANLKNDDTKDFDPMDLFDYDLLNVDEVLINDTNT